MHHSTSRRSFLQAVGVGAAALGLNGSARSADQPIQGFEETPTDPSASQGWKPVSDRKIRVGIVGYGVCRFGAAFGFQDHPNVEVAAVSDLFPDRCAALAKVCRCEKTYPSLEELVKDDSIEAVFAATDAPSHARHCVEILKHGKHAASAVPATFGSIEEGDKLFETVKTTGQKYMMFETSYFHADCYAMRQIYNAGSFGKLVYSEGEYYHYVKDPIASYKDWRVGSPPQWYPTHSAVSWDTPGYSGEMGRVRGQKGSYYGQYQGLEKKLPATTRPALPPGVNAGGHGGSHGHLMNEFVTAILEDRKPLVDIAQALNMTVSGIVAHESALKDGELMKIPPYKV